MFDTRDDPLREGLATTERKRVVAEVLVTVVAPRWSLILFKVEMRRDDLLFSRRRRANHCARRGACRTLTTRVKAR
jgi:hypothetical protein